MKHILITGATGHLGRKLFDHLRNTGTYKVTGLDIRPDDHPDIHIADFSTLGNWTKHLKSADVIVHFAADRGPVSTWKSVIDNNIDATLNLYHAAAQAGVKRVVFASSNWVHGWHRFSKETLNQDLPAHPVNAYGVSKLFGERTGKYFATHHNLSVICLRIGWTQWTHDNQPGLHMEMGRWGQEMWLSDTDFFAGLTCAIEAENVTFAALNLMSDNKGMRWDLGPTKAVIGYEPHDHSTPLYTFADKIRSKILNTLGRKLPDYMNEKLIHW